MLIELRRPVPGPDRPRFGRAAGTDQAERYFELHDYESEGPRKLTGTPAQVRSEIEAVAAEYGAEEAIVVMITHDHEARRRSYELLAAEFGLSAIRAAA